MLVRILKIVAPIAILVVGALVTKAMIDARPDVAVEIPAKTVPLVRVLSVEAKSVQVTVHAQGTVRPRTESTLIPEVAGRVVEVSGSMVVGGFFEEGDLLLRLDARDYELAAVSARAQIAQAESRLKIEQAESEVARREWQSLGRGKPSPLVLREPQLAEARAALASAQAALKQAQRNIEKTVIRAPYAGRVRDKSVDVGQYVQPGALLARLYAVDYAEVRLPLADEQLAFLDVPLDYRGDGSQPDNGPRVSLTATFAGKKHSWQGRIVRTEGEIDPRTRVVHVVAQVDDPYGRGGVSGRPPLAVGMFVDAEIFGRWYRNVVELPRSALREENQVWVVDDQDRLVFRDVVVLRADEDRVLISEGLAQGRRVCLSPLDAAVDGMSVRTQGAESEAREAKP